MTVNMMCLGQRSTVKQEGLDCMGVLYGFGNREELEKAGAVYVAGTPEDITGIILK